MIVNSNTAYGCLVCLILMISTHLQGQLSPGKLTEAHQQLEGIRNCTVCHDLGQKVSNQKCLDCHEFIDLLIDEGRGMHAHPSVNQQDCFDCHSEHHGRGFDMVRFDQDGFDHKITGYQLEGQHNQIDCRLCHNPQHIVFSEVADKPNTFLGLDTECMSCHEDVHQGSLSPDCASCHSMNSFQPATFFDHSNAQFGLNGAHQDVSCLECHPILEENGIRTQQFTNIDHETCISCHESPHRSNRVGDCMQCHTERSFSEFTGDQFFNHSITAFDLTGKHQDLSCFECHSKTQSASSVFKDFQISSEHDCVQCHQDVHSGNFGNQCVDCHTTQDFSLIRDMTRFDHSLTDFPLIGLHQDVDCRNCHTEQSFTDPIPHENCTDCHSDAHDGQFTSNEVVQSCNDCHSLEYDFSYTTFDSEDHQDASFILRGGHLATACTECHLIDGTWTFRQIGNRCIDCHIDPHEEHISSDYYPSQDCLQCHTEEGWSMITFDHQLTDWILTGSHIDVECRACHIPDFEESGLDQQVFDNISGDCQSCHNEPHGGQFAGSDDNTDCMTCHTTENWSSLSFDHNTTRFKLEGRHAEVSCNRCHQPPYEGNPDVVMYKLTSIQCADCHM